MKILKSRSREHQPALTEADRVKQPADWRHFATVLAAQLQFSTLDSSAGKNRARDDMSVWATAVIGHSWTEFSESTIQRISWAATSGRATPKWNGDSRFKSAAENFNAYGSVRFFLPRNYFLLFSKNLMELTLATRWTAILMHKGVRKQFLLGCKAAARLTGADEWLLLPEGTEMEDLIKKGAYYKEFKRCAEEQIGAPDLDIHKIYSERQIRALRQKRIHYFLVKDADF